MNIITLSTEDTIEPNYESGSGSGDNTDDLPLPDEEDSREGSGDHHRPPMFSPPMFNPPMFNPPMFNPTGDMDNKVPPLYPGVDTQPPPVETPHNTSSNLIPDASGPRTSQASELSLSKAMFTYLSPIVVLWFSGMFADLL